MKLKYLSIFFPFTVVLVGSAYAADLTWNGADGDTWDTTTSQWLVGMSPAVWNSTTPDRAFFGSVGVGTLSIGTGISANGLIFNTAGYSLQGNSITLAGTNPAIATNADASISSTLAGTAGLIKTGTGTLSLTGNNTYTGPTTITQGVVTYSGTGGNTNGNALLVGGASGRGVLNLNSSGTFTYGTSAGEVRVGGNAGGSDTGVGAINQTAGDVTLTRSSGTYLELGVGGAGNTYGSYVLSGGSLTTTSGGGIRVGRGGVGSFVQTGGMLNVGRWFAIGTGGATGNGAVTFTGGTAVVNSSYRILVGDSTNARAALNIGTQAGGNAVVTNLSTSGITLRGDSITTTNLNSGTLVLGGAINRTSGAGTSVLNLNGGTLRTGVNNATLIANTNGLTANVFNGGLTVDSQNFNTTISSNLLATTGNGIYTSGGVIDLPIPDGTGYIGAPLVTVTGGSGSGATAIANIDSATGTVTGITLTSPGQGYVAGDILSFAFAGGGFTGAAGTFNYELAPSDLAANGTGGLIKTGSGTLTLTGANTYTGANTINAGSLTYSGSSSYSGNGSLRVAPAAGDRAVVNFNSSGTMSFNNGNSPMGIGANATSAGSVNQTSGTVNIGFGAATYLQIGSGGYGSYNLSGGTLNINNFSGIRVGYGSSGSWVQTGGSLNSNRFFAIGGATPSGNGVATFTGGTALVNSSFRIIVGDRPDARAVLNLGTQAGGNAMVTNLSSSGITSRGSSNATLNLNSGTLVLGGAIQRDNETGGSYALNLNGGALRAGGDVFLISNANGLSANVFNGGLTVDSQNFDTTISANLLATTGNGIYTSGGIIDLPAPAGTGYIGAPLVTVAGGSGSGATAIANIDSATGAVTGITLTSPGQGYEAGDTISFAFTGGGFTGAAGTFNYQLAPSDLAANGNGGLTKTGAGTLLLTGTNTYTGDTTISTGTLALTSTGSIADSGNLIVDGTLDVSGLTAGTFTVGSSQTLTGTGTINATGKTLSIAGNHAVGNGVGSQSILGDLSYATASVFEWDLVKSVDGANGIGGMDFDAASVTGSIDVSNGAVFKVMFGNSVLTDLQNPSDTFWNTPLGTQTWDMAVIFGQSFNTGAFDHVTTSDDVAQYGSFSINGTSLTWTAVPEPSSALVGLLLASALLRRHRTATGRNI